MKIGFDAKRIFHNTTGLGNYGRDLVRILAEFYTENRYLLYNPKPGKANLFNLDKSMKEVLPSLVFWRKFSYIWRQKAIIEQLKEDEIEIFHGLTGEIPRGISKTSIKTVVTIHDLIFIRYPELYSFFDRKIHLNKVRYSVKNADKIIAISEQTKSDIVEFLKADASKIEVIYQGCHPVFKQEQTTTFKNKVLEKYRLPSKFILNVGTIEKRKNLLTLLKSIKNIEVCLVVVGRKTAYFEEIKSYIKTHKMEDKIYFLKGISLQELSALYQLASIFVYPSIFEGFGIPIIEALYSKTPVITSTGGCFGEAGGENSIYVNPNDDKELAFEIKSLLSDKEKGKLIAEKGYKFVQKFNDKEIAKNYMNLYKSL